MVNYRRAVCEVVVLVAVVTVAVAAPAADCTHYDQRQNGTENYRVNIDGVVIAIAPAESLVESIAELTDSLDLADFDILVNPPSSGGSKPTPKPDDSKPQPAKPESPLSDVSLDSETKAQKKDASTTKQEKVKRLKHRLSSILVPLLRRTRHQ